MRMPKSLKIGFVLDDTLDKPDGVQQYILTLGRWLSSHGHKVHYLVGETKRSDVRNIHSLSRNINVRFNHNRLSIPLPANKRHIAALLTKEKFNILHVQMPYNPALAARIIKAAPAATAIVGTFHVLPFGRLEQFATKTLGLFLVRSKRRFDTIVSVSAEAQKFAKKSFGVTSIVLPNVVELHQSKALTKKTRKDQKIKIVFLGRLVARKGCEHLLQIVALLPHTLKERLEIQIGGKGPLLRKLQRLVVQLNLSDQVNFVGFVDEKVKTAFLGKADIAIFPSSGGESFGIVLLEAMSAGAGVVMAGDNPGYRGVMNELPEVLFDPLDHRQSAERLELIIRDKGLRKRLHKSQQELVKRFNVEHIAPQLVTIYKEALRKGASMR